MAQMIYSRYVEALAISKREQLMMLEIGEDSIDSASSFVEYIIEEYTVSKSTVWYTLKLLRKKGIIDFADREHQGEPLRLTSAGSRILSSIEPQRKRIMEHFIVAPGLGVRIGGEESIVKT